MNNNIIAKLETRTSKAGKQYTVLVIKLTDTYEKLIFLDKSEIALIELASKKNN